MTPERHSGHVCHITTSHEVFDRRVFKRAACGLAAAGFPVTLIAQHERDEVIEGVDIRALPKGPVGQTGFS